MERSHEFKYEGTCFRIVVALNDIIIIIVSRSLLINTFILCANFIFQATRMVLVRNSYDVKLSDQIFQHIELECVHV